MADPSVQNTRDSVISSRPSASGKTVPGTLVQIFDRGVLLTGLSGIGKSETALGLIDRGHALVADDAVDVYLDEGLPFGSCPPLLRGMLAIRDLGALDIQRLWGAKRVAESARIDIAIELLAYEPGPAKAGDIARPTARYELLDLSIPCVKLTAGPGRNLALLVETAVRDLHARQQGYHADRVLNDRQQRQLSGEAS
ncbi:hypothetical protein [Alkalilimnicola ehrlichii]|uniref:hypothetical protein n=1 Tax=Alkalilimnicola ehrlichii TaxID=351052 RepID=UPI0028687347|nr:hypothetical protein [Alkalilimnicola ehrlichii]